MILRRIAYTLILVVVALQAAATDDLERYYAYADSADTYISRGKWDTAEQYLLKALRLRPADINNSLLLNNLGTVRQHLGRLPEALEAFDLALEMTPNSLTLLKSRASTLIEMDSIGAAARDIDRALTIQPDDRWSRKTHGLICLSMDRTEEALYDFTTLLKAEPEAEDLLQGIISTYMAAGIPAEAVPYTLTLTQKHPSAPNWYLRGCVLILSGNITDADEAVYNGLQLDGAMGELYMLKAYLSKKRYLDRQAEAEKKLAIDYGADPQMVQQFLGW